VTGCDTSRCGVCVDANNITSRETRLFARACVIVCFTLIDSQSFLVLRKEDTQLY
jgi:hypothetical protein